MKLDAYLDFVVGKVVEHLLDVAKRASQAVAQGIRPAIPQLVERVGIVIVVLGLECCEDIDE